MKKILFVSTEYPSKLGGLRGLYYHLLFFSRSFEVHYIRLKVDANEDKAPIQLPAKVKFTELRHAKNRHGPDPKHLLYPIYYKSMGRIASFSGEIQEYAERNGIDVIYAFTHPCAFALRSLRAKVKVAEVIDSLPYYYSSKRAHFGSAKSRIIEKANGLLYSAAEKELAASYDLILYISELDKETSIAPSSKLFVALEARDPPISKKNLGRRNTDVVIFGRWEHPPNRDGISRILPRLGEIQGNVQIIGPNLKHSIKLPSNVSAKGYVDDISALLSDAKICLVPVYYGAGLQNKVFDALRHGCVVVSTDFTKGAFEANGLKSRCIVCQGDLIAAVNAALAKYSAASARSAYADYQSFYSKTYRNEQELVRKVSGLAHRSRIRSR